MRRVVLIALALTLVATAAQYAGAAKPPPPQSFAAWKGSWDSRFKSGARSFAEICVIKYAPDDRKLGECFAKGMLALLNRTEPKFEFEVARVSLRQSPQCKKEIRRYVFRWRASETFAVNFFNSHLHRNMSDINKGLNEEPITSFDSFLGTQERRAVRICG
jgi:hypothetical protein